MIPKEHTVRVCNVLMHKDKNENRCPSPVSRTLSMHVGFDFTLTSLFRAELATVSNARCHLFYDDDYDFYSYYCIYIIIIIL